MQSRSKMTMLANVLFLFNGIICLLSGVVVIPAARDFQVDTYIIGYIYTLFTIGSVVAIQCNGRLLERIDIRIELLLAVGVILCSILGISSVTKLPWFAFFVFLCGVGYGAFSSTASYLIINLYEDSDRAKRLNLLHFSFSIGAILSPLLSGTLIDMGVPWQHVYKYVLILLSCVLILVWLTPIAIKRRAKHSQNSHEEVWNLRIYFIAASLFCYMIAEGSFVFWGTTFFIENLALDTTMASSLIAVFWFCMAVGRFSSGHILQIIPLEKYVLASSCLSFISYIFLVTSSSYLTVLLSVSLMGMGCSGLYASILTYGTLQREYPCAKLMSAYITFGSLGGLISAPFSSWLKSLLDLKSALITTGSFMAVVFLLIGITLLSRPLHSANNSKCSIDI
jgi:fucose permease